MQGPHVDKNYFTERDGVIAVSQALNRMKLVFRETPHGDIGIDGQIEYVTDEGKGNGQLVAAQVKSGTSYLIDKGDHYAFYIDTKHATYWENFPIPVLVLCQHNPYVHKNACT